MDGDPCDSKDTGVIEVIEITELCANGHAGLRASTLTIAQMKFICTSAYSRGSKQEEQEFIMQQEKLITLPSWKQGGEAPLEYTTGVLQDSPVRLASVPGKITGRCTRSTPTFRITQSWSDTLVFVQCIMFF